MASRSGFLVKTVADSRAKKILLHCHPQNGDDGEKAMILLDLRRRRHGLSRRRQHRRVWNARPRGQWRRVTLEHVSSVAPRDKKLKIENEPLLLLKLQILQKSGYFSDCQFCSTFRHLSATSRSFYAIHWQNDFRNSGHEGERDGVALWGGRVPRAAKGQRCQFDWEC